MPTRKPLSLLETYARCLTHKQAQMLYEAKTHKKVSKALFETNIPSTKLYSFNLDSYTIIQILGSDVEIVRKNLNNIVMKELDTKNYNKIMDTADDGLTFTSGSLDDYNVFVDCVRKVYPELDEMNVLEYCVDPDYTENL